MARSVEFDLRVEECAAGARSAPELAGYALHVHTIQSAAFRYMVESLKEVVNDGNLICDHTGMRLVSIDASHSTIVFMRLESGKFETYHCQGRVVVGVNVHSLYKLVKSVTSADVLTIFVAHDAPYELQIRVENKEKNVTVQSKLKMLDIDQDSISIPPVTYDSLIAMPSADLQRYCRDLLIVSDKIRLTSRDGALELAAVGDFASHSITVRERPSGNVFVPVRGEASTGVFSLRFLSMFAKATSLSQTVEILLKDDYPLILVYRVGDMGKLQYCLAPAADGAS
jgi:proliferating cell nuclear antigen